VLGGSHFRFAVQCAFGTQLKPLLIYLPNFYQLKFHPLNCAAKPFALRSSLRAFRHLRGEAV
jgi:hypothetical protein